MAATIDFRLLVFVSIFITVSLALDCPQCIHITHRSYHGLIRSSLDRFNSPLCGYNNFTVGPQNVVKCDVPGDKSEYKCGMVRGRASVRVNGQQQQDPDVPIDLAVRMCLQVPEDNDDDYCVEDLGQQVEFLRQALTYYPQSIPISPSNVRAYKGETCFCSDNQCISGATSAAFAPILLVFVGMAWGVISLWK